METSNRMSTIVKTGKRKIRRALDLLTHHPRSEPEFGIKRGYRHRESNTFYDDTRNAAEWQKEVYSAAAAELRRLGGNAVLDVGCGSGFKLLAYFLDVRTVGLDVEPTLSYLKSKYPEREWGACDWRFPPKERFDVVICADVLEHIPNPDNLMRYFGKLDFETLILSTPERVTVYGFDHSGPPDNRAHCREWTINELREYASSFFSVRSHEISNRQQGTQLIVLEKMKRAA